MNGLDEMARSVAVPQGQARTVLRRRGVPMTARRTVISVRGIRKTYGRTVAVDDVSFEVAEGEIFGLIGPNGAGKTTTMECIEGVRAADARDHPRSRPRPPPPGATSCSSASACSSRRRSSRSASRSGKRSTCGPRSTKPPPMATRLLEQLGLADKRNAWFMTLSGGQKQRLFIALALINDPEVVFLDELTTGLDPQARRAIWDLVRGIRERGKTVLPDDAPHGGSRAPLRPRRDHRARPHRRHRHAGRGSCAGIAPSGRSCWRLTTRRRRRGSRRIPRVRAVTRDGARLSLSRRGRRSDHATSSSASREHRIRVTEFRTALPTLEDVFLKLTGHSIRD